jgi:hypothetical protein
MINELPLALWSEAINTAVYIKNRIPHKAVKESAPYEVIHGSKPSIYHLQPFGRKCFAHIPEEKRPSSSKLLPRAVEGKFIGYSTSNRVFRIYISSQHRVIQTRQVRFSQLDSREVTPTTTKSNLEYASMSAPPPLRSIKQPEHHSEDDLESLLADNQLQREAEEHEQPQPELLDSEIPLTVRYAVHQRLLQARSHWHQFVNLKFPKNLGRLALVLDVLSAHQHITAVPQLHKRFQTMTLRAANQGRINKQFQALTHQNGTRLWNKKLTP